MGSGSDAVLQLAVVVVGRVRRVLLVEEEERRLVGPVLRRGGVGRHVRDGGVGGGGGSRLVQAGGVVAALGGLRSAVQTGRHQAVLVLSPGDLDKLQVGEGSDVEVGCVLLRGDAVVELAVAAADGERLGPVGSAQGGCSVQAAEVGR